MKGTYDEISKVIRRLPNSVKWNLDLAKIDKELGLPRGTSWKWVDR